MTKENKTLTIFGAKGGIGKTLLALNLAGVSSNLGYKTLLIDFDMYEGCLGMILNEEINKSVYHLIDDLTNNRFKKIKDYIYKYNDLIDVLPSPKDPRLGGKIDSNYINIILERVRMHYDVIIIDTSSDMSNVNIVTLDTTDEILFVIDNDIFTLKNTRNILNIFSDCNITNYKVLLNSSINFKNPYFSTEDMKKIINSNIDYVLTKSMFLKDISSYLYKCKIPSLIDGFNKKYRNDYNTMEKIIKELKGV